MTDLPVPHAGQKKLGLVIDHQHAQTIELLRRRIRLTPALGATAVLIIFMIFFREPPRKTSTDIIAGRKEEALEMP